MTKCKGTGCDKKETCNRFVSKAEKDQEYIEPVPFDKIGDNTVCEFYWRVEK